MGLLASKGSAPNKVDISWISSSVAEQYVLYRTPITLDAHRTYIAEWGYDTIGANLSRISPISGLHEDDGRILYTDTTAAPGVGYYYSVDVCDIYNDCMESRYEFGYAGPAPTALP